ncbi:MAG: porin [Hyphomicrobiaceae bacterium]
MTRPLSARHRFARSRATVLIGLLALGSSGGQLRAQSSLQPTPDASGHTLQTKGDVEKCRSYGPSYSPVGESGLCAFVGGGIIVQAAKEFTSSDITLIGQRIPTLFAKGAGVPIVYYHSEDVGKKTRYPVVGTIASAHLMLRGDTDAGMMRAFVRVTADARSRYDVDSGDVLVELRKIDESYYLGALEEAWFQWNGLKVGIQPSLFGFNRLPSVITPGYTSIVTTMAASFTHTITRNMSVSVSAEDPDRRRVGEGVLSRPVASNTPDYVAMTRLATQTSLFHLSGAIHHADDRVISDFTGGPSRSVNGWAVSAGLQTRVKWDEIVGPSAEGLLGRFGLSVAHATGAIAYLGIPFFATDYVAGSDGATHRSEGWSALASYEHMLAPRVKLNFNASVFSVGMHSAPEEVIPHLDPNVAALPGLDFEVDVRGAVLQAGIGFNPMKGMVIGVEGGFTATEAKGRYAGVDGRSESAGFPHVGVYLRQNF